MTTTRVNPYVGPRSFRTGETLYGRDREVEELLDLLIAERIVLLYSPSGAGKTSLVQAALIPRLEEEGFRVRPVMRVSQEAPSQDGWGSHVNRYIFSLLLSLEEALPDELELPLDVLAELDLPTYLQRSAEADGDHGGEVLIFDQFEEILTVNPADTGAKAEFFAQVGQALRDRKRWAVFAMREDYIAGLDRYLRPIPTRLSTTYRLDLLEEAAARAAMQRPARRAGLDFTDAAAQRLANDLRKVRVQRADGSTEETLGPYVEPVQLQVVCYRLWEKLPADARQIVEADVTAVGNVDTALSDYYAERVASAAHETGVRERAIREWCERQLITGQGIRGQVLQGPEQGLDRAAIQRLLDAYLVRAEKRRGATWFELAHDRLIEPVQKNNAEWREANLSALQRQADLWEKQNRPDGLLLRDQALVDAESWAQPHADELTAVEQDFLAACRKARATVERERRNNRLIRGLAVAAMIGLALAVIGIFLATQQAQIAEQQKATAVSAGQEALEQKATAQAASTEAVANAQEAQNQKAIAEANLARSEPLRLAAEANAILASPNGNVETAALLSLRALEGGYIPSADVTLVESMRKMYTKTLFRGHTAEVRVVAFSPDGSQVLTGGLDGIAILWDIRDGRMLREFSGFSDPRLRTVAFSPNGKYLLVGSQDGTVLIWDRVKNVENYLYTGNYSEDGYVDELWSAKFSPDEKHILSGNGEENYGRGHAALWNIETGQIERGFEGHDRYVLDVEFSHDGQYALTVSWDRTARLWDINTASEIRRFTFTSLFVDTTFSSDDRHLLFAGDDKTVVLYDIDGSLLRTFAGHTSAVNSVAFSPDDEHVLSGSRDHTIRLWDIDTGKILRVFTGHLESVSSVAFSPGGLYVLSGSVDTTARLWDADMNREFRTFLGHSSRITSLSFSSDGNTLLSSDTNSVRRWDVKTGLVKDVLASSTITSGIPILPSISAYSAHDTYIATYISSGSDRGNVALWKQSGTSYEKINEFLSNRVITSLSFSPAQNETESKYLLTGTADPDPAFNCLAVLWEIPTGNRTRDYYGYCWVFDVAFTHDGQYVAVAAAGQMPIYRTTDSSSSVAECEYDNNRTIAFSADGKYLATAGDKQIIQIWEWPLDGTCHLTSELRGHTATITDLAFSKDGRFLITGSADGVAKLWDATTWQLIRTLSGHEGEVYSVAFSPDGKYVATGGNDKTIRLWDTDYHDTMKVACSLLLRDFTEAELARYEIKDHKSTCP